jgi:hypothetical protein
MVPRIVHGASSAEAVVKPRLRRQRDTRASREQIENDEIASSEIAVFLRERLDYWTGRTSPLSLVQLPLPFVSWQVHDVSLA